MSGRASAGAATAGALLLLWGLAAPAALTGQVGQERPRLGERFLLLRGATVIDGTGGLPRENAAVLIRNDFIEEVGGAGDILPPEGAEVMDLHGKYLLPGFIDAHAHTRDTAVVEALLAAGIVAARNPGSARVDGVDYREAVKGGRIVGPRIFTAGPVIDAPSGFWPGAVLVETEAEVREAVRRQAREGVDLIKLYVRLPPPLVAAAVDEAHRHGLKAMGELVATSWTAAARAHIDFLTHIVSRSPELLAPGHREAYERDVVERRAHPYYRWLESLDVQGPEVDEMVGALLMRDVIVDPTLAVIESVLLCGDLAYEEEVSAYREGETGEPPGAAGGGPTEECPSESWPPDFLPRARAAWPTALRLVERLHREGVRLVAGSDAPFGRLPPGVSFHRELELLAAAGIPPRQVLRIATANGAVALGILHEAGTIEPGKRADLVLLDGDPLAEIRNTREVVWVMLRGRVFAPRPREERARLP